MPSGTSPPSTRPYDTQSDENRRASSNLDLPANRAGPGGV
jgi:hypothetical protein